MTTKQAADIIRMLLGYLKGELEPPKQKTIEEARAFEQQGYECLEMAIRSLEAWSNLKSEILAIGNWRNENEISDNGVKDCLAIIDRHIAEIRGE